jgi:hypothetical protein
MKEFKELPEAKVKVINLIITGSPNSVSGCPWLSVYPCKPSDFFDNPILLNKSVVAGIVVSGAIVLGSPIPIYSIDVVRRDGDLFDIDRHLLNPSGATILIKKEINKSFPEHHSSGIPYYYQ